MKNVLYLSYDGLTDPLGQSQILPYILNLAQKGFVFNIISFEKQKFSHLKIKIQKICDDNNINWLPIRYTKNPPVLSTLSDLRKLQRKVTRLCATNTIDLIHVRSYLPMFAALKMNSLRNTPVIFDMRGFWADERVEGKIWNLNSILYKSIFSFFKKKEKEFILNSSHIVSLTKKAKEIIQQKFQLKEDNDKITVIPCCSDFGHFSLKNDSYNEGILEDFNFSKTDKIICYLGSLGTWYLLDEMMFFFKAIQEEMPHFKFLFLTNHPRKEIFELGEEYGIEKKDIRVRFIERKELDNVLNIVDFGIFFIKPSFSKQASSPTKMAEFLAKGIPVVANSGVGDVEYLMSNKNFGFVCDKNKIRQNALDFCREFEASHHSADQIRRDAEKILSLNIAIERYLDIYQKLTN